MRHCLVMADKLAHLPFIVNKLITNQGVTPTTCVSQTEVSNLFARAHPGGGAKWVIAADHCRNHTNSGACQCAQTENAIFERLGRNRYRVR